MYVTLSYTFHTNRTDPISVFKIVFTTFLAYHMEAFSVYDIFISLFTDTAFHHVLLLNIIYFQVHNFTFHSIYFFI